MELDFSLDDLEKRLFKKAMTDRKWMNILSGTFDKRNFKAIPILGIASELLVKYYSKYSSIPSVKLLQQLLKAYSEKHADKHIDLSQAYQSLNEVNQLDISLPDEVANANLKEFIRRNAFYNALYDNASLLNSDSSNYDKVVDKCLENFDRVQKITFNDVDLGLDYFDKDAMLKHWEYIKNPEAKIKTLWPSLDTYTHGGFLKNGRSLYLVMAQADLGKSLFLSNLAVNFLKQNLRVVVISLEMSEDVYAQRFDAHISSNDINHLKETEEDSIKRITAFYKAHPNANLYIKEYPPKSVTCNDIKAYLENLKSNGHDFDVVIVDYLNLIKSTVKSDNMFVDGLDVSEKLRAISYEMHCPVISAVQTNTEGMNNENIGMENISQSRGIAFTADFLMAMFQTSDDREQGFIRGRILKNRLGGMVGKVIQFTLDPHSLVLCDMSSLDDAVDESQFQDDPMSHAIQDTESLERDFNELQQNLNNI